jgi:hypothetical protein
VVVGAFLGVAVGIVYVFRFDVLCASPAIESAVASCQHDEIFGWQPGSLAVPSGRWSGWWVVGSSAGSQRDR